MPPYPSHGPASASPTPRSCRSHETDRPRSRSGLRFTTGMDPEEHFRRLERMYAAALVFDVFVLTASFNVYFTRPASEGDLRATGSVVHRSRNLIVADSVVLDAQGRQVARGSGSFMRSQIALTSGIGYA